REGAWRTARPRLGGGLRTRAGAPPGGGGRGLPRASRRAGVALQARRAEVARGRLSRDLDRQPDRRWHGQDAGGRGRRANAHGPRPPSRRREPRLRPAGPLREPLTALARAGLVVATGAATLGEATAVVETVERVAPGIPVLTALAVPAECWEAGRMRPVDLSELSGARVLAFAGIAAPAAFALTLKTSGVVVAQLVPFPDHHWYAAEALASLDRRADELRADGIITTEKDWVRLRKLSLPRRPLWVLAIRLVLA